VLLALRNRSRTGDLLDSHFVLRLRSKRHHRQLNPRLFGACGQVARLIDCFQPVTKQHEASRTPFGEETASDLDGLGDIGRYPGGVIPEGLPVCPSAYGSVYYGFLTE